MVATFPLPVVVGIGHERDDTVLDYVAHSSLKTPTAVAEFFINQMKAVEEEIEEKMAELREITEDFIDREKQLLTVLTDKWFRKVGDILLSARKELSSCREKLLIRSQKILGQIGENQRVYGRHLKTLIGERISKENERLERVEQAIRLLNPKNVLCRGYSITCREGRVVKSFRELQEGENISTYLRDGLVKSKVEETYGRK